MNSTELLGRSSWSARRSGASVLGLATCPRAPRSGVSLERPARSSCSLDWPARRPATWTRRSGPGASSRRGCALRRLVPILGPANGQQGGDGRDEPPDGASSAASSAADSCSTRGRGLLRRAPGRERRGRPLVRIERNRSDSDRPRPRRPRRGARRGGRAGRIDRRRSETPGAPTSTRTSLSFATRRPASSIRASPATESRPSTSARRTSATPQSCSPTGRSSAPPPPRRTTASKS